MILTKLEVLNLDLPIWTYTFYKTTSTTRNLNYSFEQIVTDVWDPGVSRTHWSATAKQGRHT